MSRDIKVTTVNREISYGDTKSTLRLLVYSNKKKNGNNSRFSKQTIRDIVSIIADENGLKENLENAPTLFTDRVKKLISDSVVNGKNEECIGGIDEDGTSAIYEVLTSNYKSSDDKEKYLKRHLGKYEYEELKECINRNTMLAASIVYRKFMKRIYDFERKSFKSRTGKFSQDFFNELYKYLDNSRGERNTCDINEFMQEITSIGRHFDEQDNFCIGLAVLSHKSFNAEKMFKDGEIIDEFANINEKISDVFGFSCVMIEGIPSQYFMAGECKPKLDMEQIAYMIQSFATNDLGERGEKLYSNVTSNSRRYAVVDGKRELVGIGILNQEDLSNIYDDKIDEKLKNKIYLNTALTYYFVFEDCLKNSKRLTGNMEFKMPQFGFQIAGFMKMFLDERLDAAKYLRDLFNNGGFAKEFISMYNVAKKYGLEYKDFEKAKNCLI